MAIATPGASSGPSDGPATDRPGARWAEVGDSHLLLTWTARADGTFDHVNEGWLEFTGLAPGEALVDGEPRGVHALDRERRRAVVREAVVAGSPFEVEYRLRRIDGEDRWLLDRGFPLHDERGRLTGFAGIAFDVTALLAVVADQLAAGVEQARLVERLSGAERRYRELVDSLEAIVWEAGSDPLRFTFVSRRAEELLGHPVARWLEEPDFWLRLVHPEDLERVQTAFARAAGSSAEVDVELRALAADGQLVHLFGVISPVLSGVGEVEGLRGLFVDVTRRRHTERRRVMHQVVDRVLAEAAGPSEALPQLLQGITESLGWHVSILWCLDEETGELALGQLWASPGLDRGEVVRLAEGAAFAPGTGLAGRAWLEGRPVWQADVAGDERSRRVELWAAAGLHGSFSFPVRVGPKLFGVIQCVTSRIVPEDRDLLAALEGLGNQIGQFLARREAEGQLRISLSRLRRRSEQLRGLALTAGRLSGALSLDAALDIVTESARELIGAHQAETTVTGGSGDRRPRRALSLSPKYQSFRTAGQRLPTSALVALVTASNRPVRLDEAETRSRVGRGLEDPGDRPPVRGFLAAPLTAPDGRPLGVVQVSDRYGGEFTEDDEAILAQLAQLASSTMLHLQLYEERARIVEALERPLRPPSLPDVPGLELAVRYQALGEAVRAGGDFYDVFDVGDGRWAVILGDVCGKGPEAAAITGLARHTVRAVASSRPDPERVLTVLNEALLREETDRFCALVYALVEPGRGLARLEVTSAGNPPPLVLRADGQVQAASLPGTILGTFARPSFTPGTLDLAPGDAVVFYTDGLIDPRGRSSPSDDDALRRELSGLAGRSAADVAAALEAWCHTEAPSDDVAVLVVRVPPSAS